MKISAVIITKNEASNIERCLNALTGIADEIIVVDAYSQDATPDICATYPNVRFHTKSWQGYAASKNYGNNLAGHDYILSVDADEVLSEALRKELSEIKAELEPDKAYVVPRLNHIGNTKIKHSGWYPDKKLRLFPKKSAHWQGDYVHEQLAFKGKIKPLKSDLLHFTYQCAEHFEEKMLKYAQLRAQQDYVKDKKMSFIFTVLKSFFKFINIYFLKLGFLDGKNGFIIALKMSQNVFWKYNALKKLYKKNASEPTLRKFSVSKKFDKKSEHVHA